MLEVELCGCDGERGGMRPGDGVAADVGVFRPGVRLRPGVGVFRPVVLRRLTMFKVRLTYF